MYFQEMKHPEYINEAKMIYYRRTRLSSLSPCSKVSKNYFFFYNPSKTARVNFSFFSMKNEINSKSNF